VEQLGFEHILVFDHVVGADRGANPGWDGFYDIDDTFHEPFVFFGFLAGITQLELVTDIIIAPQRPTALIAKQAAEVDILSGGRFRLGVGAGWNRVEYEALGQDFKTRGKRLAEQIQLLRRFWTERVVDFDGEFDQVSGAGIAPMPVQQPIPIWMGGNSPAAFRRIGRLADGWFPVWSWHDRLDQARRYIAEGAAEAGRDERSIQMEGVIRAGMEGARRIDDWYEEGATHLSVNSMEAGHDGVGGHLAALEETAKALDHR
jgi:probable F420-dependent oxidoreductase